MFVEQEPAANDAVDIPDGNQRHEEKADEDEH